MKIGITCYPTFGGSGAVATELGLDLVYVHYAVPHATSAWVAEEMLKGERILMHISNFRPVKRIPDVVEVFARINRRVPLCETLYRDVVRGA